MQYRKLGRTGWKVSTVSIGTWGMGGAWGKVDDAESMAALHRAVELGVNFFDTADVYGDGRSERLLKQLRLDHGDSIKIATKTGRRLNPHEASGMLTGRMSGNTAFSENDHRQFNRQGEKFDRGETFFGVDYHIGLKAVEELRAVCPEDMNMTQFALRWIMMFDGVTCAIPGAKRPSQVDDNVAASDLPDISEEVMCQVREIYHKHIRESVHHRW